jgi:hypothetical protein
MGEPLDRETLFLHTLDDLAPRTRPGTDAYTVLMAAGLLRKLILDEPPLVDLVNAGGASASDIESASRGRWSR